MTGKINCSQQANPRFQPVKSGNAPVMAIWHQLKNRVLSERYAYCPILQKHRYC
jgi:hypothetical protein